MEAKRAAGSAGCAPSSWMTLAVSSRQDLDTLQAWVEELFSDVPNKDVPPAEAGYAGIISARQPGAEEYALAIEPLQDLRSLDLSWQVPFISDKDREMRMLSKPLTLIEAPAYLLEKNCIKLTSFRSSISAF